MSVPTVENTVSSDSRVTFSETKELTFTWTIPDFNTWFSQIGSWVLSPRCPSTGSVNTTQWAMKFCSDSKDGKAFCSLFLHLEACPEPTLYAKSELTMMNGKQMILKSTSGATMFRLGRGKGNTHYISRDSLIEQMKADNTLIMICKVSTKFDNVDEMKKPKILSARNLTADLATLLAGQQFGDVSIKIGNRVIPVHKAILASRSTVFAAMFESMMLERITNVVTITDIKPSVFDEMLHYIYTDKVKNVSSLSFELYAAADMYDLQGLIALCRMHILANLSAGNVAETLICADLHKDSDMKSRGLLYLSENRRAAVGVTKTAGWRQLLGSHPHLVTEAFETLANKV